MAWQVDYAHSSVEFSVRHMMISKVRGRFGEFEGNINIDEERVENSTLEGTVKVASIDTGLEDRDNHLRSADFFDAENYPVAHFKATGITPRKKGEYEVRGDLTIRGTTREVVWEVEDEGRGVDPFSGNARWALTAETEFNRSDFGLTWNVALEAGGVLVGEKVKVEVTLQLINVPEETEAEPEQELVTA